LSWRAPFAVYLLPIVLFPLIYIYVSKPPPSEQDLGEMNERFPVRHAALLYALGFITMLIFYFIPTQLPFLAIELGADSLKYGGFAVVLSQVFASVASMRYQWLRSKLSNHAILLLSFSSISIGFLLLSQASSLTGMFVSMPFIGIGLGFNFPNLTIWMMSKVPATMRGRAAGGLSTAIFLGQFLSPLFSQPLAKYMGLGGSFAGAVLIMLVVILLPFTVLVLREKRA